MKPKQSFYAWCIENNKEELLSEWNKARNEPLTPNDIAAGSNKPVWWQKHHTDPDTKKTYFFEWQTAPNNRKRGSGCPFLSIPPKCIYPGFNDLQTKDPETAKYWHPKRNRPLTPSDVFSQSGKKAWWFLSYDDPHTGKHFDFEWEMSIQQMAQRTEKCPYLANDKVWPGFNDLATLFPSLIDEWSSENKIEPDNILPGSPQKAKWICRKYPDHKWEANINSRTMLKSGCPYCANQKVMKGYNDLATVEPMIAKEWSDENKIKATEVTRGSTLKIKWICSVNPLHKYEATPNDRTCGKGCPYCAGRRVLSGDNDLQTLYPEVAKEWDYEKNGKLKPTQITAHNMKKVWWICPKGHSYDMEVANKIKDGINCPICSNRRLLKGYNDLATLYPDIAREWSDDNGIPANEIIAGSSRRGVWICSKNPSHKFEATVSNRTFNKTGCPFCNTSHGEILIANILSKLNISFKIQYRQAGCYAKKSLPFDFAIMQSGQIAFIEYDGIQHFEVNDFWGGIEEFKNVQNRDNIKNQYCVENKIPLLRIPYTFSPQEDKEKIEAMVQEFVKEGKIPDEILNFYKQYHGNNYVSLYLEMLRTP